MSDDKAANIPATQAVKPGAAQTHGSMDRIERAALLMLGNRYLWLALFIATYLHLQIALVQQFYERFHDFVLAGQHSGVIELSLAAAAIILALAVPAVRDAYRLRTGMRLPYPLTAFAAVLTLGIFAAVQLVFATLLWLLPVMHEVAPILPLTLLQRTIFYWLTAVILFGLCSLLRHAWRLAWPLCALIAIAAHFMLGYSVTLFSAEVDWLQRLNDLYCYNAMQMRLTFLPLLTRRLVYQNIESPYLGYYFLSMAAIAAGFLFIWIPFADRLDKRET